MPSRDSNQIALPVALEELLNALYPSVDWGLVRWRKGMPWWAAKSFATGITIPAPLGVHITEVYLRSPEVDTMQGVLLILHEAVHVHQAQRMGKGKSIGFMSLFIFIYLSEYLRLWAKKVWRYGFKKAAYAAYRFHPLEVEAYDIEDYLFSILRDKTIGEGKPLMVALEETASNSLSYGTQIDSMLTEKPNLSWASFVMLPAIMLIAIILWVSGVAKRVGFLLRARLKF